MIQKIMVHGWAIYLTPKYYKSQEKNKNITAKKPKVFYEMQLFLS